MVEGYLFKIIGVGRCVLFWLGKCLKFDSLVLFCVD